MSLKLLFINVLKGFQKLNHTVFSAAQSEELALKCCCLAVCSLVVLSDQGEGSRFRD